MAIVYLWLVLPHGVIWLSLSAIFSSFEIAASKSNLMPRGSSGPNPFCPGSCFCGNNSAICQGDDNADMLSLCNLSLFEVPTFEGTYGSLTSLDLSGNSIEYLYSEELTYINFPSLTKLSLRNNGLRGIENGAIVLPSLLELDLSENELTRLDFLVVDESVYQMLTVYLAGNSLVCSELDAVLMLLCSKRPQQNDGVNCTLNVVVNDGFSTQKEVTLAQYCDMSYGAGIPGGGSRVPAIVGTTIGGIMVFVTAVIIIIVLFMCLRGSSHCTKNDSKETNQLHSFTIQKSRQTVPSSHHSAPPTVPPIPPPLNIPCTDEIYAEISDPPVTATSLLSRGSVDYEDGYILNVDSVPKKNWKTFGTFAGTKSTAPISVSTPPGEYEIASFSAPCRVHGFDDIVPSEPTPYHTVLISNKHQTEPERRTGGVSLHKKKPPITPRKKSLKSLTEEGGRMEAEGKERHGVGSLWDKDRKMAALPKVGGAREEAEAEYLKVVL